eukprot:333940_1
MKSIIEMINTKSVLLSYININNNYASQYGVFTGDLSGDFKIEHSNIINNMNNGPFQENILFNIDSFTDLTIDNTQFTNNNNGTTLLNGILNGAVAITDSNFVNNDDLNTLMDINGVSSLTITTITITDNTAVNGILFSGTDSGAVNINNFVFGDNNGDLSIDGDTLILFDSFTDLSINTCNIFTNDGDYLFKATLSGNIIFTDCQIDKNDIDKGIIYIKGDGSGDFIFTSSSITRNRDLIGLSSHSTDSLINITYINSVELSSTIIAHNFAENYFVFNGKNSSNFLFNDIEVVNNTNVDDPTTNDILILLNDFINGTIDNSKFNANTQGINLITSTITDDLNILNSEFIRNTIDTSIVDIDGISSFNMDTVDIKDNSALALLELNGNGTFSNATLTNTDIMNNTADVLCSFISFSNLQLNNADFVNNDGEYFIKLRDISNSIVFENVNVNLNYIQAVMFDVIANNAAFSMVNTKITNNKYNPTDSIPLLMNISNIKSMLISDTQFNDNSATQYMIIDGKTPNGDFNVMNTVIRDNINMNSLNDDVLIKVSNFLNFMLMNTQFMNNDGSVGLIDFDLNGDLQIKNSTFIGNDGPYGTMMTVTGADGLLFNDVIMNNNTAEYIFIATGTDTADVVVNNFQFQNNNVGDMSIDTKTLLTFNSFINLNVSGCSVMNNDGEYLIRSTIGGSAEFKYCGIEENDINISIIDITSSNGDFIFTSSNITNNYDQFNIETTSIQTMISVDGINSMLLSYSRISNNFANECLKINGKQSGAFVISNTEIIGNQNNEITNNNIIVSANNFTDINIDNSSFRNNYNGTNLLYGLINGQLKIQHSYFVDNSGFNTMINVNGAQYVSVFNSHLIDNDANNLILFDLINGNANIFNTKFIDNTCDKYILHVLGINDSLIVYESDFIGNKVSEMLIFDGNNRTEAILDTIIVQNTNNGGLYAGDSILTLNNFNDVEINHLHMINNDVKKDLIYGNIFGDMLIANTQFVDNKCDFEILRVFGDKNNNASSIR